MFGCFYKERRITNKNLFFSYCTFNEILRKGTFHPGMKYLYEKYCPSYGGILLWTSRIPPSWDRMENISVSHKYNNKFTRNCLYSSDLLCYSILLINSPLDGSSKRVFQWLIHLEHSNNLKLVKYEKAKAQFSNSNLRLTSKNNTKFKLQKVLKLKLSF